MRNIKSHQASELRTTPRSVSALVTSDRRAPRGTPGDSDPGGQGETPTRVLGILWPLLPTFHSLRKAVTMAGGGGHGLTFLFLGMGSSKSRPPASASSMPSSGAGLRKGLALSADSGGDGVDGLDWSLGALQLQ